MTAEVSVHFVHPGNPFSQEPDGIVSVQRNFVQAAPHPFRFTYWGVRRLGVAEPLGASRLRFHPVAGSPSQRPRVPVSLRFAAAMRSASRRIDEGILRFDRIESAVPFLRSPLPKALFLHVWELSDVTSPRSDSRWRGFGVPYGWLLRRVIRSMDRVYLLRPELAADLPGLTPQILQRVRPFGVPVDPSMFRPLDEDERLAARHRLAARLGTEPATPIVLFAGRLESVKRPLVIPEIAAATGRLAPPPHFLVAGTGGLRDGLVESATRLAPGRVHVLGGVPQSELAELLAAADACLLPSGFEALPNVALEALACGTPVVASSTCGALADLLDHGAVGEVAGPDPRSFADAIGRVLGRSGDLSKACRQVAEGLAPGKVNAEIYEDFRSLMPAPATSGSPRAERAAPPR